MSISNSANVFDYKVFAIHRLRVNVKSLAAESRFIRREENRAGYQYRDLLHLHRTGQLRHESRIAQLALAFVRGRSYRSVEKSGTGVDVSRLRQKRVRFGVDVSTEHLARWLLGQ